MDLESILNTSDDEEAVKQAEEAIKEVRHQECRNKAQFMKEHGIEIVWKKYSNADLKSSTTTIKFNRHLTPKEEQELGILMCWQPYVTKHGKSSWNMGDSTVLEVTEVVF